MNAKLIGFGLVFVVGVTLGNKTAGNEVDFVKVPVPKVVHEKGDTVYRVPESCVRSLDLANQIYTVMEQYNLVSTEQTKITSDGRIAIVEEDMNALTALEKRQIRLNSKTVGYVVELSGLRSEFRSTKAECERESK
jgi:hypothetical protein